MVSEIQEQLGQIFTFFNNKCPIENTQNSFVQIHKLLSRTEDRAGTLVHHLLLDLKWTRAGKHLCSNMTQ